MQIETVIEFFKAMSLVPKIALVFTQLLFLAYIYPQVMIISIKAGVSEITLFLATLFVVIGQIYYMFKLMGTFEIIESLLLNQKWKKKPVAGVA